MIVCAHIEDGASLKVAVKKEVGAVAAPNQYPEDTHETREGFL